MSLLRIDGLSKSFGGLKALNDVSFEVESGSIHGLMGANGAGKTTLFSIIAGNVKPNAGRIRFDGMEIQGMRPDQVCQRGIARTFQIVRPFPGLTVRQNVETAALYGRSERLTSIEARKVADAVLAEIGLDGQADKPAATLTLSGRKRLEVARALATGPKLLMLDEVMAGLTPTEVSEMMATIRRLKAANDLTILIIEHVVSALSDLSDRITVLHHGEKIADGTARDIAENRVVQAAYFGADDDTEEAAHV
ncbi:MAG: ABC transporter ATP-binding protein [Alphaproteobacteria bacterium]|nr:ABC transporter ATP-binding protein [Alphaproteobacteria bacterium]